MAKQVKASGGTLRIIGGSWRGRKLNFPEVLGLRPTGDRIRETLFNWLQGVVGGGRCLDLFAGSGALGFEAASRGAASVDMIEADATAFKQLKSNADILKAERCQLHLQTAQQFLTTTPHSYDVVFLDPPFQLDLWSEVATLLHARPLLRDGARIYLEMPKKQTMPNLPADWHLLREKQAGDVKYCLFEYQAGAVTR